MPKKIAYHAPQRGPMADLLTMFDKTIAEWDWQSKIRPLVDQVVTLKKEESKIITGNSNYDYYPGVSGYLQAVVTIVAAKSPADAVKWLEEEKTKLEAEQPFLILKHSGTK